MLNFTNQNQLKELFSLNDFRKFDIKTVKLLLDHQQI
jgi:hypothetical protein